MKINNIFTKYDKSVGITTLHSNRIYCNTFAIKL